MAELEEKKEHHLAKASREKREARELAEKLEAVKSISPEEPNISGVPETNNEIKEASIPVSEVSRLVEEQLQKALASFGINQAFGQVQAPAIQNVNQAVSHDINDIPELEGFEMKNRQYILSDGSRPITYSIAKEHSQYRSLQYTNKKTQTVLPLRYASNQVSFFIERQSKEPGSVLSTDIIFKNGMLNVPADNIILQKFLAIHPDLNVVFKEYDPTEKSRNYISNKMIGIEANQKAMSLGETYNRAIAGLVCPSYSPTWLYDLVMEEILLFIEKQPKVYLEHANDPTLQMKGVAISALATGDLAYHNYRFLNRNKDVILEVSKNQNELDEIVRYFQTGQGRAFYEFLLNSLK